MEGGDERVVLWVRIAKRGTPDGVGGAERLVRALEARLVAGGGVVHAQISAQLAVSFAADDATEAIDLALELLDEFEAPLAVGAACSGVWRDGSLLVGAAFDDACALAGRAQTGDLIVESSLRDRMAGRFLYGRHVTVAGVKAAAIDRAHPRREETLAALRSLRPPGLPPTTAELAAKLELLLASPSASRPELAPLLLLRGPLGAGAMELVRHVRDQLAPAALVELGDSFGAVVPLDALRRWASSVAPSDAVGRRLVAGEVVEHALVVDWLAATWALDRRSTWLVLNPVSGLDAATAEVLASLRARFPATLRLLGRASLESVVSPLLGPVDAALTLPALRLSDAREVVRSIVGDATAPDVVRRVAVLAGDSTLGCQEAVRWLVSAGELVERDGAFEWRTTPRGGADAWPVDRLGQARLDLLDPVARRVLEHSVVLVEDAPRELVKALALADGVPGRDVERARAMLERERWLDPQDRLTSQFERGFVARAMPASRLSELHRFAWTAVDPHGPHRHARIEHARQGGLDARVDEGLAALAAELAAAGYAGESAPSAPALATERPGPRTSEPPHELDAHDADGLTTSELNMLELDDPDVEELRLAVRMRDVPALEAWVERATAAGSDLANVGRMRAVIDLMRGDLTNARARLERTSADVRDPRAWLAQAVVTLGAGDTHEAVRFALRALSVALEAGDARGHAASLFTLAACYRSAGRADDARMLVQRAEQLESRAS